MSSGSVQSFKPIATVAVSANASTAQSASIPMGENVLVYNDTTDVCFVAVGGVGTTADFTGMPIPALGSRLIKTGPYVTVFSAISNSLNSGTIFATMGDGTQY